MQNFFGQLRRRLSKPILFGLYGAVGCLGAAALLGEIFLVLTKIPPVKPLPQEIVLLIDCSGSMNDNNKLQEAKAAAQAFVQRQDLSENRLAVVGFGTNVQVASSLTGNKLMLSQAIEQLSDNGGTKMDIAIATAAQQLPPSSSPRHILLFTDGQPGYRGANEQDEKNKTLNASHSAKSEGISLVAVATGDAKTDFLTQLTGSPSLVFYANSGDFDQAFRQAEKAIYSSQLVESGSTGEYSILYAMLRIGGWTALLAVGTSLTLIIGQNHYMRRRLLTVREGGIGIGGSLAAGLAAGAIGQLLFLPVAGIPIVALGGRIIGWTILGTLLGGGMSFFVPNLQIRRALLGGSIGGVAGALGFLIISTVSGDLVGRLAGAVIVGFFIGLMIALIENMSRNSWLIVHWTPKEQTKINLGTEPVLLGSSDNAHIYLRKDQGYPDIAAKIYLDSGKVIMQFDEEMQKLKGMKKLRHELNDGDRRKVGEVVIEVKTSGNNLQ